MRQLLIVACLLVAPLCEARLLPPSRSHAVMALPDTSKVRVLPISALPRDAIVPVPVQSVARMTLESSVARPAAAAVRKDDGPQWIPLTSDQRWQQYSYP
ncbi:hypothetical protein IGB42_03557 [Andreprevotia sp. IGB-42]|uniref:hypothetical protein n=1 Tax=Andreprevotia sp. IGB-42 TaxID=2497473 RepID=UPI0013576122|nr:hypothetical protein [Andreprevotia sp. IGB-42]KAF0812015.1 hypothetical protein IGB42_03557 [Andreprevotia sp. IGB-42]